MILFRTVTVFAGDSAKAVFFKSNDMTKTQEVRISPPKFTTLHVEIRGIAPLVQNRFSEKAKWLMMEKMKAGSTARGKKVRDARDFDVDFEAAQYKSEAGWGGIPASAFRNASIDVCRMVGYKMTHAKMSVFVEADGFDEADGTPLVRLNSPNPPERTELAVRNATGVADVRIRPMWREWSAVVRVRFDEDQFTAEDVINLINRAGMQVGIGVAWLAAARQGMARHGKAGLAWRGTAWHGVARQARQASVRLR